MVLVGGQPVNPPPPPPPPPPATRTKASRASRCQRFFARISRNSSSPQLTKLDPAPTPSVKGEYSGKHSVSCISLYSSGPSTPPGERPVGIRVAETPEMLREGENLSVAVPPSARRKPATVDMWTGLPEEVKVQILGHLEPVELVRCSVVSKNWHALCFDGQLWKILDATGYYDRIPVDQLSKIITTAGPFVRTLNLRGCIQLHNDWRLEAVSNACRNLASVSIEGCKFERPTIHFIIVRNPRLVRLNIAGLTTATNTTCKMIAQSCPLLESLNVSWCSGLDARGVKKVVEVCKNLRELRACEVSKFNEKAPLQTLFKANKLEVLHLSGCERIDDASIRILVEGSEPNLDPFNAKPPAPPRKLVDLNLSGCSHLTDSALRCLAGRVPSLETLQLGGCATLTDSGFVALLPTLPKLTHLDIEECSELTNTTLQALARGPAAKQLQHLQCSYCEQVSDQGVMEVICRSPNLRNLEIDNTRVSDLTLVEAAHSVRHRLSAPNPPAIPGSCSPRIALRLVIYDCASITWSGVRDILARNSECTSSAFKPELVQLKCFFGWQMTVDEHMKRVLRGDKEGAKRIETKWSEHMAANDGSGLGRRRRRRHALWDDGGDTGRRRVRSGCVIC